MVVRAALVSDIPAIAGVFVASWEGAYRGLMPDAIFDVVTYEARLTQLRRYFEETRPRRRMWVAAADLAEPVGVAGIGPTRDEDLDPSRVAELWAIYVKPDFWGRGHGRDLMLAALEGTAELGFAEAALWVLDTNDRGRRFYESGGWVADGAAKVDESFGFPLREVRYRIAAAPPAA